MRDIWESRAGRNRAKQPCAVKICSKKAGVAVTGKRILSVEDVFHVISKLPIGDRMLAVLQKDAIFSPFEYDDAFAAEAFIWLQDAFIRERLEIEFARLAPRFDAGVDPGDRNAARSQKHFRLQLVVGKRHRLLRVEGFDVQKIAGVKPQNTRWSQRGVMESLLVGKLSFFLKVPEHFPNLHIFDDGVPSIVPAPR